MSLDRFRLPRLGDKLREQAEQAELEAAREEDKELKRSKITKKKSRKSK